MACETPVYMQKNHGKTIVKSCLMNLGFPVAPTSKNTVMYMYRIHTYIVVAKSATSI